VPSRLRVPLGYVLALVVLVLAHPSGEGVALGLLVAIPGEVLRVWAAGHIEKTRSLATGGPYAYTRNPLYLGSLVMALGAAIASGSLVAGLALALYLAAFYPAVIREESAFLARTFPEYARWAASVPAFLPRLTPAGPQGTRFSFERVLRNREWKAALALPGMVVLFALRELLR
jgi:protein-S-isoprenylcysteine O-methyltransferase Ste14